MFLLKLLFCHFLVLEIWWFAVWIVVPFLALLTAWLVARRNEVLEKSAWNTLGRLWADMGWAVLGAAVVTYIIATIYVFRAQLVPSLLLTDAITGMLRTSIAFLFARYYVFCSIVPLLAWVLLAWLVFIVPGNRIAKAKIQLD